MTLCSRTSRLQCSRNIRAVNPSCRQRARFMGMENLERDMLSSKNIILCWFSALLTGKHTEQMSIFIAFDFSKQEHSEAGPSERALLHSHLERMAPCAYHSMERVSDCAYEARHLGTGRRQSVVEASRRRRSLRVQAHRRRRSQDEEQAKMTSKPVALHVVRRNTV